jgi:hypothetical protein
MLTWPGTQGCWAFAFIFTIAVFIDRNGLLCDSSPRQALVDNVNYIAGILTLVILPAIMKVGDNVGELASSLEHFVFIGCT